MKSTSLKSNNKLLFTFLLFVIDIVLNASLCIINSNNINANAIVSGLYYIHFIFTPLIESTIIILSCVLIVSFMQSFVFNNKNLLIITSIIDIILGIVLFLVAGCLTNSVQSSDEPVLWIVNIIKYRCFGYSNFISFWYQIYTISTVILSISFFVFASQKIRQKKRIIIDLNYTEELTNELLNIKKSIHANEQSVLSFIRQSIGFDYYGTDFYKQTRLPINNLNHIDGSIGEFHLYAQIIKASISDLLFIFNRKIPKSDGLYTEIDLILIHPKGIFVLENKDYTRQIYGNANQHDLTIIDNNGHKKTIYNPIRQNERHVSVLAEYLKINNLFIDYNQTPIHSIVVFTDTQTDGSDKIIENIDNNNSKTKLCTSQNIGFTIKKIINETNNSVSLPTHKILELLLKLDILYKN